MLSPAQENALLVLAANIDSLLRVYHQYGKNGILLDLSMRNVGIAVQGVKASAILHPQPDRVSGTERSDIPGASDEHSDHR